jgi:hypothetical protein
MSEATKTASATIPHSERYERDYYTWAQEQARALREHRIEEIDRVNLAEEIEGLAKSEKHALQSRIARLLEQLLKLTYTRERMLESNARGWQLSARNARDALHQLLHENPGLHSQLENIFIRAYRSDRNDTLRVLRLPDSAISEALTWTLEQTIDEKFFPRPRERAASE